MPEPTSQPYKTVTHVDEIDLSRHGLIEASAGTGKTYTIENLVVRLLASRDDLELANILLVTYTEKAAGELKLRIREKIEAQLAAEPTGPVAIKLAQTLDAFDSAAIHTIHGFCHTVLRDFAFENESLFQNELVDDAELAVSLIKERMRSIWPRVYGRELPQVLALSGFSHSGTRFLGQLLRLAVGDFRPLRGDKLLPQGDGVAFADLTAAIFAGVTELKGLVGPDDSLARQYGRLNINKATKTSVLTKIVHPLVHFLKTVQSREGRDCLTQLAELIVSIERVSSQGRRGIACLLPLKWLKAGPNPQACPALESIVECFETLSRQMDRLRHRLTIESVHGLQADLTTAKRAKGWISYDDMLALVARSLKGGSGQRLLASLRQRYRVAFVDEFQDTDPVQWSIFRRIFLEGQGGLLFLVGDPKQAIYSFRGADVHTYLTARYQMEALARQQRAGLYVLATNWRSSKTLITLFNRLFQGPGWFPPPHRLGPFQIGYQSVEAPQGPRPSDKAPNLGRPLSRSDLNIIDLTRAPSAKAAKPLLAAFIAEEIETLLEGEGAAMQIKTGPDGWRPLDPGDICILVRGRTEAALMEAELIPRNIPYSFYKKPGLFLSEEAFHLSCLLHAVMRPTDPAAVKKALLTPFFDLGPQELRHLDGVPTSHPIKGLLARWYMLAQNRQWGTLFQSLVEESGFLYRRSVDPDWERIQTNTSQICDHLQAMAHARNLDFRGLVALLDGYRKGRATGGADADIHQIESEAAKVSLMTMHVSKGLQFPVIFVAGGLTQPFASPYHCYHAWDGEHLERGAWKILDLTKRSGKEEQAQEALDEDKRIFYVAFTRAMQRLYVPHYPVHHNMGWVGPVGRFISQKIAHDLPPHTPGVTWLEPRPAERVPKTLPGLRKEVTTRLSGDQGLQDRPLRLPPELDFSGRRPWVASFTNLVTGHAAEAQIAQGFTAAYQTETMEAGGGDELGPDRGLGHEAQTEATPADAIPGGATVGSMFHDILETIEYDLVISHAETPLANPVLTHLIGSQMERYRVDRRWLEPVATVVAKTLTTPITLAADPTLVLGRLPREQRVHEAAFYFPFGGTAPFGHAPLPAGTTMKEGYVRGFVDLIFRHGGKYYMADWKSNRIAGGYHADALAACMDQAGYHLQYQLYGVATMRWLRAAMGAAFDPRKDFGGVLYLFLRGLGHGPNHGVYFVPPEQLLPAERLEEDIFRVLRDRGGHRKPSHI